MKKREDKHKDAEALHKLLESTRNLFVTGFEKLTVQQDFQLRKAVRGVGGGYKVVKNNLAANAAKGTPSEAILSQLAGMTSLAYTSNDPAGLAKALAEYAKENPAFTFKAGLVEGRVVEAGVVQRLAEMPPREELFAKLMYLIQAPAQNLVRAINGAGRNLAVVLGQAAKENKFSA